MLYSELNNFMQRASVDVTSCRVFPLVHVPLNLLCVFEALMPRLNAPCWQSEDYSRALALNLRRCVEFGDLERRRELEVASGDAPLKGEGDSGGLGKEDCGLVSSRVYGRGVISRRVASLRRDGWRGEPPLTLLAAKTRSPRLMFHHDVACSQPRCRRCRPRPWPSVPNSATSGALDAVELGALYTTIGSCKSVSYLIQLQTHTFISPLLNFQNPS